MAQRLNMNPIPLQVPIMRDGEWVGTVDIVGGGTVEGVGDLEAGQLEQLREELVSVMELLCLCLIPSLDMNR